MTTLSPTKARSNFAALLKKAAAGEEIGIRYGKKVIALRPVDDEDTSYAEKEYGVTKAELKRFAKRMNAQIKKDIKEGNFREYHGDIEAMLKD
jgi:antitoxin (DNA-binding transcriptional repressor) of toxin-antitoxin stability system